MELKRYQERVLSEVGAFLSAVAERRNTSHASLDAWEALRVPHRRYQERKNGIEEDLPSFCLKIPTGGGKTLLAARILGLAHETLLDDRNGCGLCLWVVPSEQIYRDTLTALRDRGHPYRQALEAAVGRRIEVWQREDIRRLTPVQLASQLNVLLVQLASTNRETKEQLRFFRDSGGAIVQHFPPEERVDEHAALKRRIPNLDLLGGELVATSVANLVRLCRPAVILDEGHKATSPLARRTIETMNPSLVVELSATPPADANVLVKVSGRELLDEEMIKLPINVSNSNEASWQDCLARANDRRRALAALARTHHQKGGELIRPIVLVQVERTGKDQRDGKHVHTEDVREHLVQKLAIPATAVAVKTSSTNEIEDIKLLDEGCPIEWIVTKAALQEGWDCPFAYILVSLNASGSQKAMTQLVGRVLRQPEGRRTGEPGLDESYVYCLRESAAEVVKQVKSALEREGYEGDLVSAVDRSEAGPKGAPVEVARVRGKFKREYVRPFEGRIFLPHFCVKGDGGEIEALDYFAHLIARVDVDRFDYSQISKWDLESEVERAKSVFFRVTLDREAEHAGEEAPGMESDGGVCSWLVANLSFDQFSQKEHRRIVTAAAFGLLEARPKLRGKLSLIKHPLLRKLTGFIEAETDLATEAAFKRLYDTGKLLFYLQSAQGRFEIPSEVTLNRVRKLRHDDDEPVQRSLFDKLGDDFNPYEKTVALYLDRRPEVLWWYRNLVGSENFAVQGFRKGKVYPDFVVQGADGDGHAGEGVLVIETKGSHLAGNEDTKYKRELASYFEKVGKRVPWQKLAAGFTDRRFRFQIIDEGAYPGASWKEAVNRMLDA